MQRLAAKFCIVSSLMEKTEQTDVPVDRISALLDHLIHHIMTFLPGKDVSRTATLSKSWYRLRYSFPILHLYGSSSCSKPNQYTKHLLNSAYKTLKKFAEHDKNKYGLLKFHIEISEYKSDVHYPSLLDIVSAAMSNKVQHIIIFIHGMNPMFTDESRFFCFPAYLFVSESITVIELFGCVLREYPIISDFLADKSFKCLKKLDLENCYMDEQSLSYILDRSRFIEELCLTNICKFKKLDVSRLRRLKILKVNIGYACSLEMINVEGATCLESFEFRERYYSTPGEPFDPLRKINIRNSLSLRFLVLDSDSIVDSWLNDLLWRLPSLERLKLHSCNSLRRVKISSVSLKRLELQWCEELEKVDIDAPNLLWFYFEGDTDSLSSINVSSGCEVKKVEF